MNRKMKQGKDGRDLSVISQCTDLADEIRVPKICSYIQYTNALESGNNKFKSYTRSQHFLFFLIFYFSGLC